MFDFWDEHHETIKIFILCLFRALTLLLQGNERLEEERSKLFAAYLQNMEDVDAANFQSVCLNDTPTVEDLTETNSFLYDIDIMDGVLVGEHARRRLQKYCNSQVIMLE